MDLKSKIVLIYGPTASGKSNFAIKLAKKISGEIINADSMQVYKELKVLSARPTKKDFQKIKHHLYGFQSVKKNFSTGDWLKLVNKKIINNTRAITSHHVVEWISLSQVDIFTRCDNTDHVRTSVECGAYAAGRTGPPSS